MSNSNSAVGNYRCFLNAFDEASRNPKLPAGSCDRSLGIKVKDSFVYKADRTTDFEALTYNDQGTGHQTNPNIAEGRGRNLMVMFHPGLAQYAVFMNYAMNKDGRVPSEPLDSTKNNAYAAGWEILKVGNNGVPFNIELRYAKLVDELLPAGEDIQWVNYMLSDSLEIKKARVISAALRITNIGLNVADVVQVMQNPRNDAKDFGLHNYDYSINTGGNHVIPIMMGGGPSDNDDGYSRRIRSYFNDPSVSNNGLPTDFSDPSFDWQNARTYQMIPSGSVQGIQVNNIREMDDISFMEYHQAERFPRSSFHANDVRPDAATQIYEEYTLTSLKLMEGSVASSRLLDFFLDKNFDTTWIKIESPDENLELLFDMVVNYEIQCGVASPLLAYETHTERLRVEVQDVKDIIEKKYGTLVLWDNMTGRNVTRTVEEMLSHMPVYGATTGMVNSAPGVVTFGDSFLDNDTGTLGNRSFAKSSTNGVGGMSGSLSMLNSMNNVRTSTDGNQLGGGGPPGPSPGPAAPASDPGPVMRTPPARRRRRITKYSLPDLSGGRGSVNSMIPGSDVATRGRLVANRLRRSRAKTRRSRSRDADDVNAILGIAPPSRFASSFGSGSGSGSAGVSRKRKAPQEKYPMRGRRLIEDFLRMRNRSDWEYNPDDSEYYI